MKPLTSEQIGDFQNAKICHICKKEFKETDEKVKEHNHLNGL